VHWLLASLIVVRIYNYAGVPAEQLASAEAVATAIFQRAAISTAWTVCRVHGNAVGDSCEGPVGDDQLIIRLIESSAEAGRGPISLGESLIETGSGHGVLATVNPGLTMSIAQQSGTDASAVLGRAMAHELGHLLLGSTGHSERGLMRALWSQAELRANHPSDWVFSPLEASAMRRRLARSHSAN
jgi:hypothetical protein